MSIASLFNLECDIYRLSRGSTYPPTETWTRIAQGVPCARSSSTRTVMLGDGTERIAGNDIVMMEPRDVAAADRIIIDSVVYECGPPVDMADQGREYRISVLRLPAGTAAEMGVS